MNARGTPEKIGVRHGADEVRKLRADRRSTRSPPSGLPGPESAKALPMPANHGLGANDVERLTPACPPPREPNPKRTIEAPEPRSLRAVAEQSELLPEPQVLQREIGMGPERCTRGAQESEYEGHCAPASLDANRSSSATIAFWQTTAAQTKRFMARSPFSSLQTGPRAGRAHDRKSPALWELRVSAGGAAFGPGGRRGRATPPLNPPPAAEGRAAGPPARAGRACARCSSPATRARADRPALPVRPAPAPRRRRRGTPRRGRGPSLPAPRGRPDSPPPRWRRSRPSSSRAGRDRRKESGRASRGRSREARPGAAAPSSAPPPSGHACWPGRPRARPPGRTPAAVPRAAFQIFVPSRNKLLDQRFYTA